MVAANYVYKVAKPDGLTMGIVQYTIYMDQLVGRNEVQFDVRRFGWIGSPVSETVLLYMRSDAPYKSIKDIVKAKQPPKCGSSGTVSADYLLARLLEDSIGAKFNTVLGYAGEAKLTSRWKRERWSAERTISQPTLVANPLIAGTKKILIATSCRRETNAIPGCPIRRPFTNFLMNTKRPI